MRKRILITGGSGLLALNWALHDRLNHDVFLVLHERVITLNGTQNIQARTDSFEGIETLIEQVKPDLIIHTAGLTNIEDCEKNPDLAKKVNTILPAEIAKACKNFRIPLVHISTDHLFSGNEQMLTEDFVITPMNSYAVTKAEAERLVSEIYPEALIIRTNFFGWGTSYRSSFSDQILKSLRAGKEITLFEDVFFTPILAEFLILAIHELIEMRVSGIYHVVSDERISKYDFGVALARIFRLNENLILKGKIAQKTELVQRPRDMSLSNQKTITLLGHKLGNIEYHLSRLLAQEQSGLINEIKEL